LCSLGLMQLFSASEYQLCLHEKKGGLSPAFFSI
jgi:hypothetical protein